ncbi:nicotinate-nucleotide--dimethylbenzimidazole phosphoribosyltransferase [Neisseria sp. Ec49-e6-T10]|uniref:nicotinate-nucleotide--dimethylbenzimidazole phosphoribosyltransferase n=1 Tax=Neisseria sp. Ec49-e6-T10 TaxID=3140744 RepID=UPI003EB7D296
MKLFNINKPDDDILPLLEDKINNLTKPKGSLGALEDLATQIGWIQQTLSPQLNYPHHIVFAADHGIAHEKVSLSPQEITYQMILNFLSGGAGVNFLAKQHGFTMKIVDAGVNYQFKPDTGIIDLKIRNETRNFLYEAAMTHEELEFAIEQGAKIVDGCADEGCNVLCIGEMGIANTSASSMWMTCLTDIPLEQCVGAGSGLNSQGVSHKYNVLKQALENYQGDYSTWDIIRYFGGFEMVMTVGAMLRAAELKMVILIDGFIMTCCLLAASKLYPEVLSYAVFGHQGDEAGHKQVLDYLGAKPLLNLGLRLGEGTGALCAYPLVESAVKMINEMSSFKKVQVTKYF